MTTHVYIPSRARVHLLEKTRKHWQEQDCQVHVVIDKNNRDFRDYTKFITAVEDNFNLLVMEEKNIGMGAIRQTILGHAADHNLESFVMADDDSFLRRGTVEALAKIVLMEDVIGVGASSSFHGLMIGNEVLKTRASWPIAGGYGHILVAINVSEALACGGYDPELTAWGEDTELQRKGIGQGIPWYYTTVVEMGSVAKRYSPGGLADQYRGHRRKTQERKCHQFIYDRWPDYISKPELGRFRCSWKRIMADYCAGYESEIPDAVKRALAQR